MKFGPRPISQVEGKVLGHNITGQDGRRLLRKGKQLTAEDIDLLNNLGRTMVYVATFEKNDIAENAAALRIAQAVSGSGLALSGPSTGRVNILAEATGVLRVDAQRLTKINSLYGITLATLLTGSAVQARKLVATIKVPPFAIPEPTVAAAEAVAFGPRPIMHLDKLAARQVSLILSGSPQSKERIIKSFQPPLQQRLQALNAAISAVDFVTLEDTIGEEELARQLLAQKNAGADLIILAGETAIMDRQDIAPRAVERAGGEVCCYGAPVDPGNLLLLAYLQGVPVLGAPGCVRSPKRNIVDLVLPRLLAGDRLGAEEIFSWGHGGLLEDIRERPSPRRKTKN